MNAEAHHLLPATAPAARTIPGRPSTRKVCTEVCVACGLATSSPVTGPTMKPESTAFLVQSYSIWLPQQDGRNIFHD